MEKFSLKKRAKSFVYAFAGIKELISKEHNAWIHSLATILVVVAGLVFSISKTEWIAVIICIGMVFTAEGFNTAIERLVDLVSPEYNKKAGIVKDIAAGAVLISAICAAIIGCMIFIPKIIEMANGGF